MASWYGGDAHQNMSAMTDVRARRHFILLKALKIAGFAAWLGKRTL
jgi:hypothetical protein